MVPGIYSNKKNKRRVKVGIKIFSKIKKPALKHKTSAFVKSKKLWKSKAQRFLVAVTEPKTKEKKKKKKHVAWSQRNTNPFHNGNGFYHKTL